MSRSTASGTARALRLTLALAFLWFGALKLADHSPALDMIHSSLPWDLGYHRWVIVAIGLVEVAIGLAFLTNRLVALAAAAMIGHLAVATGAVLITQGFDPFPVLSIPGEFVIKNLVLMAAGLILLSQGRHVEPAR